MKIKLDKIIRAEDIKTNSILFFKSDEIRYEDFQAAMKEINKIIGKKKKLLAVLMNDKQEVELLSEKEMNRTGWFRKGK